MTPIQVFTTSYEIYFTTEHPIPEKTMSLIGIGECYKETELLNVIKIKCKSIDIGDTGDIQIYIDDDLAMLIYKYQIKKVYFDRNEE